MIAFDVAAAERELASPAMAQDFDPGDIADLPEPVRRYFAASISPGTAVATATRLRMRGRIKIGRWMPFRAEEVLAPHRGFV